MGALKGKRKILQKKKGRGRESCDIREKFSFCLALQSYNKLN